jgi:ABC-type amino acid transport substrate-binding protein
MSTRSNRLLLGIALAGLILESLVSHPALATDKVSLFKVITAKDEIIIGINDDQLSTFEAKNAGGVAKHLVQKGTLTAWQYAVRKAEAGALEQAPLRQVGLMSTDALRVEPYTTPLKIVPLPDVTGQ